MIKSFNGPALKCSVETSGNHYNKLIIGYAEPATQ